MEHTMELKINYKANELVQWDSKDAKKIEIILDRFIKNPLSVPPISMKTYRYFTVLNNRKRIRSWESIKSKIDLQVFYKQTQSYVDDSNLAYDYLFTPAILTIA